MNILVIGGTGFIGSNLCKFLIEQEEENIVYCMDNNFTGSLNNIECLMNHSRFHYIYHDILNPIELNVKIDHIYHLACPASPPKYQADPIYTSKVCYIGTLNALSFSLKNQSRILFTSTSEVYGDPDISPQVEEYRGNVNTIGPRSCYDEGKRIAETLMMDFHTKYNSDIRIVRIFNTYGQNMDPTDGRVISNFITQCLYNKDITIYGDGSQTRSFCFVDDMIFGLVKMMNQTNTIGPVNLGNPVELTISQIADKIKSMIPDSESQIIYKELPKDDPRKRKPNIEKAKLFLDWEPLVDLEDGLRITIYYFRNHI
jgi:UDP-glucuronate decarboxylase